MKGSAREHLFNQQRGQLDTISDSQGGQASPILSGLQLPHLEKRTDAALHTPLALHPRTPTAVALRVPQQDLMAKVLGYPSPLTPG